MEQQFNYNNELSGKIALVTGGTKGAGKAIAERLKAAGATVVITARNKPDQADPDLHFPQNQKRSRNLSGSLPRHELTI